MVDGGADGVELAEEVVGDCGDGGGRGFEGGLEEVGGGGEVVEREDVGSYHSY